MNILFVCTGNTCRSPMAEHLFRKLAKDAGLSAVEVASAGLAPAVGLPFPDEARAALAAEGVAVAGHRARGVDAALIEAADLLLVMERRHRDTLVHRFPEATQKKVHLLHAFAGTAGENEEVADPFGGDAARYRSTLAELKTALQRIVDKLSAG